MNVRYLTSSSRRLAAVLSGTLAWLFALGGGAMAQGVQLAPFGGQDFDEPLPRDRRRRATPSRVFVVEAAGHDPAGQVRRDPGGALPRHQRGRLGRQRGRLRVRAVLDGARPRLRAPAGASTSSTRATSTRASTTCGSRSSAAPPRTRTSPIRPAAGSCSRSRTSTPPTTTAASSSSAPTACSTPGSATGDPSATRRTAGPLLGKILRIDPAGAAPFQYSIPAGNPYADGPGGNGDEIYASGFATRGAAPSTAPPAT